MKTDWIWVAAGSAIGGLLRYWTAAAVGRVAGADFPFGTLLVNVLGALLIGAFAAAAAGEGRVLSHPDAVRFVVPGLLGGFTTFSAFSLQTFDLARGGQWGLAGGYILASVGLCLLGVWAGHTATQAALR